MTLQSFSSLEYSSKKKRTKRKKFLGEMDKVVPWERLGNLIEPHYILAQGRRGHIAVDYKGEKYALSRYVGIKAKQVRGRLGETEGLPSVEQAQKKAAEQITDRLKDLRGEQYQQAQRKQLQADEMSAT